MIVVNYDDSILGMAGEDPTITIGACLVGKSVGALLLLRASTIYMCVAVRVIVVTVSICFCVFLLLWRSSLCCMH